MFEDDDFDVEDVDFSFIDQATSLTENSNNSFDPINNVKGDSPQRKIPKRSNPDLNVLSILQQDTNDVQVNSDSRRSFALNSKSTPITKRKFPGPAGLLPQRGSAHFPIISDINDSSDSTDVNIRERHDIELASSQYGSIFDTPAWRCASQDLADIKLRNIQDCNISNLKRTAFSCKSKALKYPFLLAAIFSMDIGQELFVTLRDTSGDIQAYINSEVVEQFQSALQRGSVIVLKKVGVLKSGKSRGIYLLVTPNNVALIYPPDLGTSKLPILMEVCQNIDCNFSALDVSLNSSLDSFLNSPNASRPSSVSHRIPTPNLHSNINQRTTTPIFENKVRYNNNNTPQQRVNRPYGSFTPSYDQTPRRPLLHSSSENKALVSNSSATSVCDKSGTNFSHPTKILESKKQTLNVAQPNANSSLSISVLSQNGMS